MVDYLDGLDNNDKARVEVSHWAKKNFHFGGGDVYSATKVYTIPAQIGEFKF